MTLPPPPFVVRVLESEAAEDRGKTFEVAEGSATLGREDDCTIVLNDAKASRHHARVAASPDGNYRVVDTQSANGVWVDERRVSDEVLSEGQRFRIGSTLLECRRAASAAAPDGESTLRMAGPWRPSSEPTGQRLGEAGEPVEFIGKPFLIDDAAFAYYVVSGKAEIFTITVQGRRPVGARSHFATVDEGHAFFGIDLRNTRGLGFMAQGRAGTVLRRISRNDISQMASDGPVAAEIAGLVDAWVASLTAHVVHDILTPPEPACRLETGQSATLPPGVHASVVSGVQWLPVGAQELLFLGTSMLGPDAGSRESFFPPDAGELDRSRRAGGGEPDRGAADDRTPGRRPVVGQPGRLPRHAVRVRTDQQATRDRGPVRPAPEQGALREGGAGRRDRRDRVGASGRRATRARASSHRLRETPGRGVPVGRGVHRHRDHVARGIARRPRPGRPGTGDRESVPVPDAAGRAPGFLVEGGPWSAARVLVGARHPGRPAADEQARLHPGGPGDRRQSGSHRRSRALAEPIRVLLLPPAAARQARGLGLDRVRVTRPDPGVPEHPRDRHPQRLAGCSPAVPHGAAG